MAKIKYKIVAEHMNKGIIEIPISRDLLHSMADVPFMMDSCQDCWDTFKLNKIDKDVKKFHDIIMFLAFDVEGDGFAYQQGKDGKMKKIKSDFVLIKKPKWKKKKKIK